MALIASGVSVAVAIALSPLMQAPDLPGYVVVATGIVATLLAYPHVRPYVVVILASLVSLMAALVALHLVFHRQGMPHDWLELLYVGTVVGYSLVALTLGLRTVRPGTPSSSTAPHQDAPRNGSL